VLSLEGITAMDMEPTELPRLTDEQRRRVQSPTSYIYCSVTYCVDVISGAG
jgi:hypothetical protein